MGTPGDTELSRGDARRLLGAVRGAETVAGRGSTGSGATGGVARGMGTNSMCSVGWAGGSLVAAGRSGSSRSLMLTTAEPRMPKKRSVIAVATAPSDQARRASSRGGPSRNPRIARSTTGGRRRPSRVATSVGGGSGGSGAVRLGVVAPRDGGVAGGTPGSGKRWAVSAKREPYSGCGGPPHVRVYGAPRTSRHRNAAGRIGSRSPPTANRLPHRSALTTSRLPITAYLRDQPLTAGPPPVPPPPAHRAAARRAPASSAGS